jgi:hypothetical protein
MLFAYINIAVGLVKGSLWLALWLAVLALAWRRGAVPDGAAWRRARMFFTLGAAALLIHAILAFDGFLNWSHEMGYVTMEMRTGEFLPVKTGGAIYATYLFLAVWLVETVWSWVKFAAWQRRPRWLDGLVQLFLLGYGFVLVVFLGGVAAYHLTPLGWTSLAVAAVAAATWTLARPRQ